MRFAIYLFATVILSMPLIASSGGQTGRTSTVSSGCGGGGCHGSSANTATTLRVQQAVDGKISVTPGSQTTITVIVAHATRPAAGVNIAVKTTATSSTAAGTLALIAGEGLRISAGELTHSTPKNFTAGETSFSFSWTAPTTPGTYFLRAISNAVNRDGSPGTADNWNWLAPIQIVVSEASSVNEYSIVDVSVAPVPSHESVSITVPSTSGEKLRISIVDQVGAIVSTNEETASGDSFRYVWDGRRSDGSLAPQGHYIVSILSERRLMKGRAIIIR